MKPLPQDLQAKRWDAIVIGSGITGGWAAKELTEKGLETLVLEAGPAIDPDKDYPEHVPSWDLTFRGLKDRKFLEETRPVQSRTGACDEWSARFFVNDLENPYSTGEGTDFDWIRSRQVGGRSMLWGRQSYRWSDLDFGANARDGVGVDWPIRYQDVAPWYDHVESFAGISGQAEGLAQLPDGIFQPPLGMNVLENHLRAEWLERYSGERVLTQVRSAVLTQRHKGRKACHYCGVCRRGCSGGSFFSSNYSTLPAAEATGRMTLRANSVVAEILYDETDDRASGVRVIDRESHEELVFRGRIVFLCASTIESARLLLNSKSRRFPNGLANSSQQVGRNLMDHVFATGANGEFDLFDNKTTSGNRPNSCYLPRFRNLDGKAPFLRGWGAQCGASRGSVWQGRYREPGFGAEFKDGLFGHGPWRFGFTGFGECLPDERNRIEIDPKLVDKWGIPAARMTMEFRQNEEAIKQDIQVQLAEMLEASGAKNVQTFDRKKPPGLAIHEMGTVRMGKDPKTSVLNGWNQAHEVPNLFVTDGAAMASTAWQNPSLTYMALTARACDYAVKQMADGRI